MTGISLATVHDEDLEGLEAVAERCGWGEVLACVRRHSELRESGGWGDGPRP